MKEETHRMLTEELNTLKQDYQSFCYIVSHDLQAPLRGINTLVDWLAEDYREQLDETGRDYLDLLKQRVTRMHILIQGLLRFSRADRITVESGRWNIHPIIRKIQATIPAAKNTIIETESMQAGLFQDIIALDTVWREILTNAVMHSGTDPCSIRIQSRDSAGFRWFTLDDNGQGIPKPMHLKVMELFKTVEPVESAKTSGVGLTIALKLIQRNGGSLALETSPDTGGCRVVFNWPFSSKDDGSK